MAEFKSWGDIPSPRVCRDMVKKFPGFGKPHTIEYWMLEMKESVGENWKRKSYQNRSILPLVSGPLG